MNSEIRYLAQQLLHAGLGPFCERDRRLIARVAKRVHTARDVNKVFEQNLSFGDRLADKVAVVAGSWIFIIGFCALLVAWAVLNARRPGRDGPSIPIPSSFSTCCSRCWPHCRRRSS